MSVSTCSGSERSVVQSTGGAGRRGRAALAALLLTLVLGAPLYGATRTMVLSGNFTDAANYSGGNGPLPGDDVAIDPGVSAILSGNFSVQSLTLVGSVSNGASLTINNGATLTVTGADVSGNAVTIGSGGASPAAIHVQSGVLEALAGDFVISGGGTSGSVLNAISGTVSVDSIITSTANAVVDFSAGNATLEIEGDFTGSGPFVAGPSSTVVFNGDGPQTFNLQGTTTFANLTVNPSPIEVVQIESTIVVDGTLDIQSATLRVETPFAAGLASALKMSAGTKLQLGQTTSSTLVGMPDFSSYTLAPASTIAYDADAAQNVTPTVPYQNLAFAAGTSAATKQFTASTTIAGNMAIGPSLTVNLGGGVVSVAGNVIGTGTLNGGTANLQIAGQFTHSGTWLPGTGTVTYNGVGGQTARTGITYYNLVAANSSSCFFSANTTVANDFTVNTGAFPDFDGSTMTVAGDVVNNSAINDGTLLMTGTTATLDGNGAPSAFFGANVTIGTSANVSIPSTANLNFLANVTLNAASTLTNNGAVNADSSFLGAGTLINATNAFLSVFSLMNVTLDASAAGNTVVYDGDGGQTVATPVGNEYHHLTLSAFSFATTKDTLASLNINGDLTLAGGLPAVTFNPFDDLVVAGNVNLNSGSTFNASSWMSVAGNWNNLGATFNPGTSVVNFIGSAPQSIDATTFSSVLFDNGIKTFDGAINALATFEITGDAVVNGGAFSHVVNGNWVQAAGGVFNPGTSTVSIGGSTSSSVDATTFNILAISKSGATATLFGDVDVLGNLSVNGGTLDTAATFLDVDGNVYVSGSAVLTTNGTLTVGGNIQTDGGMGSTSGTVVLDGAAAQTWTGLTAPSIHNLEFANAAGATISASVTVSGALTLTDGILSTSAGGISVTSSGLVNRTNGWINGRLNWAHAAGGAKLYPLGTSLGYAPFTTTIAGAGQLDASITDATHPNANGANVLDAFWTVFSSSTVVGPIDVQFVYHDSDVVAGSEAAFVLARYDGAAWNRFPGSVSPATNTATLAGAASYIGTWTVGEEASLGGVAYFEVTSPDLITDAGVVETITITAKDSANATVTGFSGPTTLVFDGASLAPDTTAPTAKDSAGLEVNFGSNTAVTFTAGVATVDLKLYAAENAAISVIETATSVTGSVTILVNPAAPAELVATSINAGSPIYATVPFTLGIGPIDAWGNPTVVTNPTTVDLTLVSGSGTLGGTLTGVIAANDGNVNISGITYDTPGALTVDATASAGDSMSSATIPLSVSSQIAGIVITSNADSGAGTFRDAINRINNGECTAPCSVTFNITPSGPHTIVLATRLPDLDFPASFDGTSQPGYAGTPVITVDAAALTDVLAVNSNGSTINALSFANAGGSALVVNGNSNVVSNSWLGLDPTGTFAAGNDIGIEVSGNSNTLQDNVVSGNATGIELRSTATSNVVRRNLIGTDAGGDSGVANGIGVRLIGSATSNTLGGASPGDRNVISGNSGAGINLVGTLIVVDSTSPGDFGGVTTNAGGLVELNVIENNLIGVQIDGTSPLGNGSGLLIGTATSNNILRSNTIANNSTAGIAASNGSANFFTLNSIFDNGSLGIDLVNDGVTANDVDDVDAGSNGRQNFPVVSSATLDSFSNAVVAYSIDGPTSAGSIRVELFKADTLVSGEGMTFLTSQCTAGNDFATSATFPAGVLAPGNVIVATATSYSDAGCTAVLDGTSEFSAGATVAACTAPTPTISASGPTTFCAGGSVTLTASAADSWLWSTGDTTQSIVVNASGSYSVTATTSGCSATSAATTVTVNPAPVATITAAEPTTFCAGGNVTLIASNGDSWLWSTGETTQSIDVTTSGSYTVTVTTSGCSATSAPTTVTVNPLPVVNISGPASMCTGGSVVLDAGAGFSSYLWSTGETTPTITVSPTAATTYSVTVTDGNSCSNSDSHTVNVAAALTPVITGPASMCAGSSVTLDAGAGFSSYSWSTGETTRMIAVSPTAATTYSVTVSDGTCSGTDSHTVAVTPAPVASITPSGPTTFCEGGSVTLTASTADSYLWSTGETTQSIVVSTTGSYNVQVTTSGCSATSSNVAVNVTPNPIATITASGPTAICDGDSVTLTASTADSYLWSSGETTQSIVVSSAGSYTVTVMTGGCSDVSPATTVTVNPAPTASIAAPASVCASSTGNSASVNPEAGATYAWTISNGTITSGDGTPSIEFTAGASGTLSLGVTVTVGSCTATDSAAVSLAPAPVLYINAPSNSEPDETHAASVVAQAGATYSWSIVNGSILAGETTNAITFKAGPSGQTKLIVEATIGSCTSTEFHFVDIGETEPVRADLAIEKTAPSSVAAGSQFAYTLVARNAGPDGATAFVKDVLPAGVTFVSVSSTLTCGHSEGEVTCSGNIAPATSRPITIMVNAPQSGGTITNTATISSAVTDPQGSNNSASASTSVTGTVPGCPAVAPVPLAPAATTVSSPVAFSWTASDVATQYELWIVTNGIASLAGTTTATSLSVALSPGAIEWYVVARGGNCDPLESAHSTATVSESSNCGAPPKPQLTSPKNSALTGPEVTFTWTASPGAIGYRVWVEVNGTAAQDVGTTDGTTTSLTVTLPAGAMTASVEALFSGCPPARSASVSFRVGVPDPCGARTQAFPMSPANGATLESSTVAFKWSPANEPDGYRVWYRRNGGTPEVLGATVDETELEVGLQSGAYEWWIEALYDGCASTESDHRTFNIPQRSGCSTIAPALLEPAAHASLSNGVVTFRWTAVPNAVRYEVWLAVDRGTPSLVGDSETTSLTVEVADGEIEWFVRAIVDRCPSVESQRSEFSVAVPEACDAQNRPVTVSPVTRSLVTAPFDCVWTEVPGATHYEVFVRRGGSDAVSVGTTTATRMEDLELPNGNVRWFVRAHFAGCPARDSAEEKLEVVPETAACGTLDVPMIAAVAQVSSGTPFLIQWTPSPGATAYQLQVADNAQFTGAEMFTVHEASHELMRVNLSGAATPLFARVRALDGRCPRPNVSAYSLTAGIYVLPFEGNEGASPVLNGIVSHTIKLGSELAGQSFVVSLKEPWLTATPMSGVVGAGGTDIVIGASITDLPFGSSLGTVTVTLTSAATGGIATHATSIKPATISISKISPVTPTPKSTPPPDALIIPAVAHANGVNAQFQSDVRVTNSSAQLINYQLTFTPSGDSGIATGKQTNFAIEAGKTVALDDVLRTWFGTGSESVTGTLEVRPLTQTASALSNSAFSGVVNLVTFASSRTFNMTANGTFGQHIPAIPYANFIGGVVDGAPSKILSLQQIAQSDRFRTNLGIVEGSGEPVSLLVKVFGESGQKLVEFPLNLAGGQHTQLNSFLAQRGVTSLSDGRIEVSVTSPGGKITAYASVLDNATSDPLLVSPISLSDVGATKWVVPGVADLNSNGANWRTDMRIFNADPTDVDVTLSFHSQGGGAPKTSTMTIPAGQVRQLDGTLASVFGATNDGGAVHIETATSRRLITTARTYNQTTGGTFGQFISGVTPAEAAGVGSRPLQLLQVEETARFRTNIGIAEVSGSPVTVEVAVVPPDAKFSAVTQVTLGANEFRQLTSILRSMGLADTYNARVTVKPVGGSGRVTAYASVIDALTNDPTYIPAQ